LPHAGGVQFSSVALMAFLLNPGPNKHDKGAPLSRATFDELFLTAHERVATKNT
jgi:hypothetical protein